jgi:hypothetical protein
VNVAALATQSFLTRIQEEALVARDASRTQFALVSVLVNFRNVSLAVLQAIEFFVAFRPAARVLACVYAHI